MSFHQIILTCSLVQNTLHPPRSFFSTMSHCLFGFTMFHLLLCTLHSQSFLRTLKGDLRKLYAFLQKLTPKSRRATKFAKYACIIYRSCRSCHKVNRPATQPALLHTIWLQYCTGSEEYFLKHAHKFPKIAKWFLKIANQFLKNSF